MTETKNQLMELFAACWRDDALKARFLAEPRAVLDEYGLEVPEGVDVKVVENAPDRVYITFPAAPIDHEELSDDELNQAFGGTINTQCVTPTNNPIQSKICC